MSLKIRTTAKSDLHKICCGVFVCSKSYIRRCRGSNIESLSSQSFSAGPESSFKRFATNACCTGTMVKKTSSCKRRSSNISIFASPLRIFQQTLPKKKQKKNDVALGLLPHLLSELFHLCPTRLRKRQQRR